MGIFQDLGLLIHRQHCKVGRRLLPQGSQHMLWCTAGLLFRIFALMDTKHIQQ